MKKDYTAVAERIKNLNDPWLSNVDPAQLDIGVYAHTVDDDSFTVPLQGESAYQSRITLDEDTLQELAGKPNLTSDEQALVKQHHNPAFKFHTSGYEVAALWNRGRWECTAEPESEDGDRQSFRLAGLDRLDRDGVMASATRFLGPKRKPWKELSESELLAVARMAPGSPESAIYTYIHWALPDIDEDVSANPKYQELCDKILYFVAENHFPEFDESAYQFMSEKLGNRPLTWRMITELFAMWKEHQFDSRRPKLSLFNTLPEEEETPESIAQQLNDLSDSQVSTLRQQTVRLASRR